MEEEEQNRYVAQLKEEFDSCDTTGTGYLDKEELTALCHKLHLDAHLPLLLGTLLGPHNYARVNFEEFKEGFVAVLSRSLDLSTSEEESSYLEPVVPEEVKPKFVKGTKRYGRRSRPDRPGSELTADSEETPPRREDQTELFPAGVCRAKLRRSTSLESVESLKSDEEPGSNKETTQLTFEAQGQLKRWKQGDTGSPRHALGPSLADEAEEELRAIWEELGVGVGGFLSRQELSLVCESIGLQDLCSEELDLLFRKLDKDQDGRVSLREFQRGFCRHGSLPSPTSSSTPIRSRPQHPLSQAFEDSSVRSASPSLLSATVGQRLLSRLDDGSGCTSPEQVMALWSEEGIRNSKEILQTLDFSLDERLSLAELTLALDNELLVSGNGIHQAALVSYKNEIQFLHVHAEQASRERDKAKADLELAERRNLQLVSEVDDRHTTMETLNESKIKALELEYRGRLTALRSESEQDSEVLLQQVARERAQLQEEVEALRAQQASHQEEVRAANHENRRLEEEVSLLKGKLSVSETTISRLQKDLDHILLEKFGSLDPDHTGLLSHEERFSEIIKEYELQCRELRDRNDELSSELEMLKNQAAGTPSRRVRDCTWSSRQALATESDSDDPDTRKPIPNLPRKRLQVSDKNGLGSLDSDPVIVSIETELALEQLKEKHSQEVQDLKIQLETKVNFYERSLELMRHNMEVERKDISQGFKMEISELEEQKAQAEEKAERLRQSVAELRANLQSGAWGPEQERRRQREQAELEQNYAREIANLVQRLTSEKDQLEMELKLKMDQEVQLVREEAEQQLSQMELQYSEALHILQHQLYRERSWQQEREGWVAREVQQGQECVKQQDGITLLSSPEAFIQPLVASLCTEEEEPVSFNTGKYGPSSRRGQLETAKEDEPSLVGHKLKEVQEVLKNGEDDVLQKALEDDEARLMKKLENQGANCEQLQIDDQEQHLDRGRKAEQGFRDALGQEENKVPEIQSILDSERQERNGLIQEKDKFSLLCDQLSTPTVEIEADSVKLMEDIGKLRLQLKQKDNMILKLQSLLETEAKNKDQLRFQVGDVGRDLLEQKKELYEDQQSKCMRLTQLEVKVEEELCVLAGKRENSTSIIQQALKDAQAQVQRVEEEFELEKGKMKEQLLEMERLVMALEPMMDQASPHRVQLDEVISENTALKDRISMLQTDVQRLEEDVNRKKKRMEELEKDHGENREELERLYKEKAQRREETLGLSARNLQLSEENSDLRAHLQAEQSAGHLLRDRLERLSQELEEQAAEARRLQETSGRQERELAQLQGGWQRERLLLEKELKVAKEKLQRLSEVETELASLILKHQWLEQDKQRLLKEAEEKAQKGEKLLESLSSLSTEMEQLRSQVQAASLDRSLHAQELAANQRMLQDTTAKVREMEASVEKLRWEKEQLSVAQKLREDGETQALRCQNQELLHKVSRLQVQEVEVQRVTQECLILKTKQAHLENELLEAQDQCLKAEAALAQAQARHSRETQKVREEASAGPREQLGQLQARLAEEQRRGKQLEEHLHSQARQAGTQMVLQQEHYEKVMRDTEEKMEEVERKLKNLRMLLQEKVNQLKEQLSKNTTVDLLLKDLYVENSQLMKALQVTEQRQKTAEKNNFLLQEKIVALNMLLRKIAPAALST